MGNQYTAGLPPGGRETTELPSGGRVELSRPAGGEDYVQAYHVKVIDKHGRVISRRIFNRLTVAREHVKRCVSSNTIRNYVS